MERPAWVDDELYPFEDHWQDGIHYVDEGSGPPLLMLHGNPTWSFTWRRVIQGLSGHYRCIAPDLPGFGLSKDVPPGYGYTAAEHAQAIERFVEALDLRDVTLMVQDWGGPIGFAVAGRMPERFSAYVIGNTWAWSMQDNRGARAFSGFLGSPIGQFLILRGNLFVDGILRSASRDVNGRAMAQYRGPFPTAESRRPVAIFPKEIIAASEWLASVERAIPQRPALLVWPTADPAFRAGERRRWEELLPDHRTVLLEGARHYIGEDAPDEIVAALLG